MLSLLRWSGRLLAVLLALLLLGGVVALGMAWSTLPPVQEEADIPGLSAPVQITLDEYGIPRIRAETERDAVVALGYLHARDRMFQMESMRRSASGRLAELVGEGALRLDRFSRTLGLAQRAEADLAALPAETRDALEAYAEGVNAWIASRGRMAAPEFLLLGEPEPWRPEHSLLWGKVMGLWLSSNWRTEVERARIAPLLPPERLRELWPEDDSAGTPDRIATAASAPLPDATRLARLLDAVPRFPGDAPLPSHASNAWALAPSRSATGSALLASDPHLGFQAPILWYLARIDLPGGRFLAGATSPGVPFMVIGRNERVAWGFTTTHSDTQDVFVERLLGADSYETPEGPRPFAVREERIAVRGREEPEVLRVRETRHGPVVSDLDGVAPAADGLVLAVAMANLRPGDTAAAGLHALNRARNMADVRAAAALITSPPQNLMAADADGRIAMYLTGRTPIRRAGDGAMPAPGWDDSHAWTGFVPFDEMPHIEDPESGVLVNANNRPAPASHPVFLGRDFWGDWRFRRIHELLAARPQHRPEDMAAIQTDAVSFLAQELLPLLRDLPRPGTDLAARALDLLRGWDGTMAPDLPQPLIFNAWSRAAGRAALTDAGIPEGAWNPSREFIRYVLHPDGRGAAWCLPAGGCPALAAAALERAVADLAAEHGSDPTAWRWGEAHVARFEHAMLRFVPGLSALTRLEAETGGDAETVMRAAFTGEGPRPFANVHGAGLRGVFDLSDPDGALAVIATGQSGHPLSAHWGNMLQLWRDGRVVTIGERPGRDTGALTLRP